MGMHNFDVLLPIDTQSADFYTGSARVTLEKAIEVILRPLNGIKYLAQLHAADASSFPHGRVCPAVSGVPPSVRVAV